MCSDRWPVAVDVEREAFETTLGELDFRSLNQELELGFGFWGCVVGFFKAEKRCECKELILFLPWDFSAWVQWCRKHQWHQELNQNLEGSQAIREPLHVE